MSKAVVLFSGGLDSTLCLDMALKEYSDGVLALSLYYGQRNEREAQAAAAIVNYYRSFSPKLYWSALDVSSVWSRSRSSLIATGPGLSEWTPERVEVHRGEVDSSVEFRNGVFISIAAAQAMSIGASHVWIGTTGQGATQYADCGQPFLYAMGEALHYGSSGMLHLACPLARMDKVAIVEHALKLNIPLALTWTCYDSGEVHCGKCLACVERKAAFEKLGRTDYVTYG